MGYATKRLFVKATRKDLVQFLNGTKDKQEYKRGIAILLRADGKSFGEIKKTVGIARNTAVMWVGNFRKKGIDALRTKPRSGRPPVLKLSEKKEIIKIALTKPNLFGHLRSEWSLRFLINHLSKELGIKVSRSHLQRILSESGIKFKRPKATIDNKNAIFYRKSKEIRNYKKIASALEKKSLAGIRG